VTVFNPPFDNPGAGAAAADRPLAVNSLDQLFDVPMIQTYSLGVERELIPGTALSVSYVGSRGTHLERARDINQPFPISGFDFDPQLNTRAIPTEQIRPYQGFAAISQTETTASSTYHALQATLQRRMSKGLLFEGSYTWSRTIADASGFNESPQNAYNLFAERGAASFDRTHMLILNSVYEIPFMQSASGLRYHPVSRRNAAECNDDRHQSGPGQPAQSKSRRRRERTTDRAAVVQYDSLRSAGVRFLRQRRAEHPERTGH
jgi:hypothetical protein